MALPQFIYGGNTGINSPEELARARMLAEALLGPQRPAQNVGEGLAVVGQAIRGRREMNAVNRASNAGAESAQSAIAKALGGAGAFPSAPAGPSATAAPSTPYAGDLKSGIQSTAEALGIDPVDLGTAISYETAGTFNPTKKGPTTQWGQHKGLIQFGEPQAQKYGVDWQNPVGSQLGPDGAVAKYLRDTGVKPGMGLLDIYSAINAGGVGKYGASDANNGGAPGTVRDKVEQQMAAHRAKAMALLGGNQVASNEPSGVASDAYTPSGIFDPAKQFRGGSPPPPDPLASSDPTNTPDPLISLIKALTGGGGTSPTAPRGGPDNGVQQPQPYAPPEQQQAPALAAIAQAMKGPQPLTDSQFNSRAPQVGPQAGQPAASTPAGQRVVQQMVNPQPMSGGAPLPMMGMPQQAQAAPPQLQQPVSDPQQQVAQNLPVMAGGNADAIPKGQLPSVQDLMQAAQNPWLNDGQRAMVNMLLKQQLDQADPNSALDAEYKRAQIDALKAKPDQTPESVRALTLRAQAAGLKEGTPEYQQFMLSGGAPKAENKPSGIQEYEYAKSQGFPGTFQDWEASKKGGMSLTVDPATGQISFQQGSNIKPMTEAQSKDTTFATRAAGALPLLDKFGDALTSLPESTGGNVPVVGNYLKSPEYQQAEQAGKEFLQAILRKDTGAAITKEETAEYGSVYLPRPGDSPELLAQKKASRTRALEAMKAGMTPQAILAQEKAIAASGGAPAPEAPKKRLKFNPATGELE